MSADTWRWGELFELDVPEGAAPKALGDMVELSLPGTESALLLAAFSPLPGPQTQAVQDALVRFALTRGFPPERAKSGCELHEDATRIVTGRLTFLAADAAWSVLAMAWPIGAAKDQREDAVTLVLAFCDAPERDDPIFDLAEALFTTLRPLNLVLPAALSPDANGTF